MIFGLLLLLLALAGTPLFAIIAASALMGFYSEEIDLSVVAIEIYRLAEMPVLLAIPLFTFAGYLLGESGAPSRLVRLTNAVLGWMTGGLAIGPGEAWFWGALTLSMLAGFLAPLPYNYYQLRKHGRACH